MSDLAVETRGLSKCFGSTVAVADLSISIPRGEVFGFLGPNGAGKTTSVKLLLALIAPTGGDGRVLGVKIGDRAVRGRIGFLPEHFRFHDVLTGRELLRLHGRLYGRRGPSLDRRIDELLDRVDLAEDADRPLRQYSKGMTQRVGLAQALINEPDLVFLDEPTSGLDPLGRRLVRDVLGELRGSGTTVFLNSHLLGEVESTCDRVVFVKGGRTISELWLKGSMTSVSVELRIDRTDGEILNGLARFGDGVTQLDGLVSLRIPTEDALPQIARWLIERGVQLYAMTPRRPSLEQVFMDVMGEDQRPG
jgi:ABC-2 type transport system ATP-binding protein